MMRFRLLLILSLLSPNVLRGYPSDVNYNTDAATFISKTNDTDAKASTAFSYVPFIKGDGSWIKRIDYSKKSLVLINFLIAAIIISIVTMIILLIIILLNRKRMEKEEQLHQYLMEKYQSLIINYLFGSATPEEFLLIASDSYRRHVLIDQIIDVSINLKGKEIEKLFDLYKLLGLDRDSIKKAHSRQWHKKVKGIRELAYMNIKDANDIIYLSLIHISE